jgi:putative effector of murein hydrolase
MSEADGDEERQEEKLRRVGYGIALAGVLTVAVDLVSVRPRPIVVYGLLGLAVAVFVLGSLQSEASGLGLGLLVGSLGGWVWRELGGASYAVLGVTLVIVGLVNAATTPYFRRLGERLAGR